MKEHIWRMVAIAALGALGGGATLSALPINQSYMTRQDVREAIDQHPAIVGIQFELRRISKSLEYIEGEMRNANKKDTGR